MMAAMATEVTAERANMSTAFMAVTTNADTEVTDGFPPRDYIGRTFPVIGMDLDDFHAYLTLDKGNGATFEVVVDSEEVRP